VDRENQNESAPKRAVGRPDWRRIRRLHHSPLFWIGASLGLAAIAIYVLSLDLAWRPRVSGSLPTTTRSLELA